MYQSYQNELYHHGVKGMKWGVRRSLSKSSGRSRKKRDRTEGWSEDAKSAASLRKKKINQMSNAELRKLNERKQLENQYRQLNPSTVKKGMTIAAATAGAMGTVVTLYTNGDRLVKIGKSIAGAMVKKS